MRLRFLSSTGLLCALIALILPNIVARGESPGVHSGASPPQYTGLLLNTSSKIEHPAFAGAPDVCAIDVTRRQIAAIPATPIALSIKGSCDIQDVHFGGIFLIASNCTVSGQIGHDLCVILGEPPGTDARLTFAYNAFLITSTGANDATWLDHAPLPTPAARSWIRSMPTAMTTIDHHGHYPTRI